jgi:hypothetical protein
VRSLALELGLLLALSVLFPFLIHVLPVPETARLGARLLPMFYAPLLAALIGRIRTALVVAVLAPWLNRIVTGYPPPGTAVVMTVQLLTFVAALRWFLANAKARWFLAVPAYAACMGMAALIGAMFPETIGNKAVAGWLFNTVTTALPGVAILVAINWLTVRNYPTGSDGSGPMTA